MDLSVLNKALNIKTGQFDNQKEDNLSDEKILLIEVEKIKADPNQPRKTFIAEDIQQLADDIKSHGLIQPIIVRTDGVGQYIVVAGERRLRAFQLLKESKIKAIVRNDYSSDKLGFIQIAENIKRADLKFYELAEFIISKVEAGIKQTTLADEMGISRAELSRYMTWKDAPEYLKDARDKFSSIRAFYDLGSLASDSEKADSVQDFVNNCERITSAAVKEFKKSLTELKNLQDENQDENDEKSINEVDISSSVQDDSSDNSNNTADDHNTVAIDDLSASESNEDEQANPNPSEKNSKGEEVSENIINTSNDEFVNSSSANDVDEIEVNNTDNTEWEDAVTDENLKIKKPLIVGSVEGREGYLQYKKKPSTDGFIWIKWDDGFEEEIIAEDFKINRIIEE